MPTTAVPAALASAPPASSIPDVLDRMRAIEGALPANDGIAWFNRLYQRVTENVAARIGHAYFADDAYIARMDVVFANYYFAAVSRFAADPASAPRCWAPLFAARADSRIAPIVFALAGMNAHINHDLAHAVFDLAVERGSPPVRGGAEHADYLRINTVLGDTIDPIKPWFERGLVAEVDARFGRTEDAIALFSIEHAREAAWTAAETFWALRPAPAVAEAYEVSLDRLVGMASRGMLALGARAEPILAPPSQGAGVLQNP
jgi:hypothetical protein